MLRSTLFIASYFIFHISVIAQKTYDYPIAPKSDHVDVYHGEEVADPYHWMENPDDPRLEEWLKEQNKISRRQSRRQGNNLWNLESEYLSLVFDSYRMSSEENVEKWNEKGKYEFKYDVRNYLYKPLDLLYRFKGTERYMKLVDISDFNKWRSDESYIVSGYDLHQEYDLVFVKISNSGSDWSEGYFYNLATNTLIGDTIKDIRTGSRIQFYGRGILYSRFEKENYESIGKNQKLFYHKIGTQQEDDVLLYQTPDNSGQREFEFSILHDSLIYLDHYVKVRDKYFSASSIAKLDTTRYLLPNTFLIFPENNDTKFYPQFIDEDTIYLKTTWNAPNGKLVKMNLKNRNQILEFIPQFDKNLKQVDFINERIFCIYSKEGNYSILVFDTNGNLMKRMEFPKGKKVNGFRNYDSKESLVYFSLSSFNHPAIIFELSLDSLKFNPVSTAKVPFDASQFETRYIEYFSKDGVRVPMYIICKKNLKLNGKNPTLLYAYGGYGVTIEPEYDELKTQFVINGGVLAIPNIRGGGTKGSQWSDDGRNLNKQNGIDDFNAAAEYLIDKNYTSPSKLVANGKSHGGLIVTAAAIQQPQLYQAVIANAGPYDMVNFSKYTIGSKDINLKEFGRIDNKMEFKNIVSYSPYHNIKEGVEYPDFLLITAKYDDRVLPFHSFKLLARLQEKGSKKSFYHMYYMENGSHNDYGTKEELLDFVKYKQYYLFDKLGIDF